MTESPVTKGANVRAIAILLVTAMLGCASGGSELPPRVLTAGEAVDFRVAGSAENAQASLAALPDEVWRALPQVFEQLQIPVSHVDAQGRVIGNRRYVARRTVGGESIQRYFNCGSGVIGPLTATHDVVVSVLVQVLPDGDAATRLQTSVEATAQSRGGASGHPVPCGSSGRLEGRIAALTQEAVE